MSRKVLERLLAKIPDARVRAALRAQPDIDWAVAYAKEWLANREELRQARLKRHDGTPTAADLAEWVSI